MGRQRRVYRPVRNSFPEDFPARLLRFKERSGHSWRSLAHRLGVQPKLLRAWRSGVVPSSIHLFHLLALADRMGLRNVLLYPENSGYKAPDSHATEDDVTEVLLPQ